MLEGLLHLENGVRQILVHELSEPLRRLVRVLELRLHSVIRDNPLHPGGNHVLPLHLLGYVKNTSASSRRRRRKLQVANLEDELHVRQETDSLV